MSKFVKAFYVPPFLLALGFLLLVGIYIFNNGFKTKNPSINEIAPRVCTRDVFTCPDGSSVPRSGPNCEFVCPGHVSLEVSPRPTRAYIGDEISLDLNAIFDTGNISGIDLHMSYNPSLISVLSFAPTEYLPLIISSPVFGNGSITTSLGSPIDLGGRKSWGTIAKLKIKPLYPGLQTIIYDSNTIVTSFESSGNVLKSATPIQFNVYYPGDLNQDKEVDVFDYNELVTYYGEIYDIFDYNDIVTYYKSEYPHQMSKR